mmetsp:Transcript_28429/g.53258  ORF Transcript_28429/g.53258 Transcript_28429/m.53258 type:complete len:512 (-) Transcript_28429:259-1794(-)|eukprot:CAMPEP_0170170826 /NCGR_PEP_ID=MMETSP0040_2-20121228/3872_1 /TAXON_ID=641309 /ORGANISM="Lotharella oceanica, Strain CCMP622" /LENGTH=511 /DNA_ID=CAMNT_0010410489 /DNA_START=85 /DNA_END=1620 /DNA_ORIENTATION=-
MSMATLHSIPTIERLAQPMVPTLARPRPPAFSPQRMRRVLQPRSVALTPKKAPERESALLDELLKDVEMLSREGEIMRRPSTSTVFFTVLSSMVLSLISPHTFSGEVTEVLVPTAASIIAVCTTAAEFRGKDSTSDAKEVAAVALARAAQAEAYLARAERAKAIIPAMVGVSATAATSCLIFPILAAGGVAVSPILIGSCPVVATAAAAYGALGKVETLAEGLAALGKTDPDRVLPSRVTNGPGVRRKVLKQRVAEVMKAIVPSIALAVFLPGEFTYRCVIAASVAAAQVAYSLAEAETICAEVTMKVTEISKAAAKADVFANRAAAESSVLPFTSAIGGVVAVLSAALVEFNPAVAGLVPAVGGIACGVATTAASRSEMDSTSTRLAFRNSGIRRAAPVPFVPGLFKDIVPALIGSYLVSTAKKLSKSFDQWRESLKYEPPSPPSLTTAAAAASQDAALTATPSAPAVAATASATGIKIQSAIPAQMDAVNEAKKELSEPATPTVETPAR